ncbi:MAG: TlpA disulfide reductase family protein, partial [Lysobacterales bacterium]
MRPVLNLLVALCLFTPPGAQALDATADTDLQPISFTEWDAVLENLRGSIVVVDYWASWCPPCIERFPHMVEMHHRYADRGVQFISLNLDEKGDTDALDWCNDFLARVKAEFPNYHVEENMTAAFERLDLLGLPVVRIYAPDGSEAYKLTGDNPYQQFTEQDVEDAILELLA